MTWEQFVEKFREEYILLVDWERLAQDYFSLKQTIETVTEITKMLTYMALFFSKIFVLRIGANVSVPELNQD